MFEKLRELKLNITMSAVLMVVLGIVLLFWPATVSVLIGKLVGLLLIVIGAIQLIFVNPKIVVSVIPIIFGILLVVHGVQDIAMAFEGRAFQVARWGVMLALGIVNILLGLICIACAFGIVNMIFAVMGIMLIYDGVTDMLIVHRVNKASRYVDSEILREEDIED